MSLEQPQSQQGLNRHASSLIQNPDAMKVPNSSRSKPEEPAPVKKEEPATTLLSNPSRVLEKQKKVIQYLSDQRYDPIFKDRKQGLIMLVDK
jgi:26S proteasome regulatory subunit N2